MRRTDAMRSLSVDRSARAAHKVTAPRALLILGWSLATIGYYGPWIAHSTAALTLVGGDLAEFVKFLPGVMDGSIRPVRELFYLPPAAVVLSIAILASSRSLGLPGGLCALLLLLAIPVSLQLLPPAWSVASLGTAEFRLQASMLGALWLCLGAFWLWRRMPLGLTGSLSVFASLGALGLVAWQLLDVKPAIDKVYGSAPSAGWGFLLCMVGLAVMAAGSVWLAALGLLPQRGGVPWSAE